MRLLGGGNTHIRPPCFAMPIFALKNNLIIFQKGLDILWQV
jgi:hypothetical protein